jgi:hypothetical protein
MKQQGRTRCVRRRGAENLNPALHLTVLLGWQPDIFYATDTILLLSLEGNVIVFLELSAKRWTGEDSIERYVFVFVSWRWIECGVSINATDREI